MAETIVQRHWVTVRCSLALHIAAPPLKVWKDALSNLGWCQAILIKG